MPSQPRCDANYGLDATMLAGLILTRISCVISIVFLTDIIPRPGAGGMLLLMHNNC